MNQSNLNIGKRRWFDLVKDYDCKIPYHPGKANVVVNTLSRRAVSAPNQDMFFSITVMTPVLEMIRDV